MTTVEAVSRAEVVSMWLDVLAGRVSREEASRWAEPLMLGDAPFEDVMTGQGLQYLHGWT